MNATESLYLVFLVIFLIFLVCLLITGAFLLYKGIKLKLKEAIILGLAYLLLPTGFIGNMIFGLGRIFQVLFTALCLICIGIFTYLTFHYKSKSRKPKYYLFLVVLLILIRIPIIIIKELILTPIMYYTNAILLIVILFLIFDWLAYSSYSAYKIIKDIKIESWIEFRYKLIVISSVIYPFYSIWALFQPWDVQFADPSNLFSTITFSLISLFSVGFGISVFIAWIMPMRLKKYINQKQGYVKEKELDLSDEELMNLLKEQISRGTSKELKHL
jgi:hypothetical protein